MEQLPLSLSFVGINVSKDRLYVHIRSSGQTGSGYVNRQSRRP